MRRIWILAPAALLLAACGGSSNKPAASSTGTGPALQTISLSEKEFSITPKAISVPKTGTYTFEVKNNGQIPHALVVAGNGVEHKTADIQPGGSATLTVDLSKKGSYQIYCPIDGHRQNGMQAALAVGGAAAGGMTTGKTTTGGTTTNKGGYGY
ncbi:MAG: cupredoxin domain-containing protein [Gaiellaceae bacterium]